MQEDAAMLPKPRMFIILLVIEVSYCSCLLLELFIVNVHCVLYPIC